MNHFSGLNVHVCTGMVMSYSQDSLRHFQCRLVVGFVTQDWHTQSRTECQAFNRGSLSSVAFPRARKFLKSETSLCLPIETMRTSMPSAT